MSTSTHNVGSCKLRYVGNSGSKSLVSVATRPPVIHGLANSSSTQHNTRLPSVKNKYKYTTHMCANCQIQYCWFSNVAWRFHPVWAWLVDLDGNGRLPIWPVDAPCCWTLLILPSYGHQGNLKSCKDLELCFAISLILQMTKISLAIQITFETNKNRTFPAVLSPSGAVWWQRHISERSDAGEQVDKKKVWDNS